MCLSRTQTILILSLLGTGTDSSPMRSNSVLEGHFMISSDSRGKGQGGRHLQEVHWHTLDVWNSLGSVLGTKIKVSPHRLCLSLGEGQPLLCLNSPGCYRAQESILDYKIKRGDLNQCSLNMHTIAVFPEGSHSRRFIQKEATNLDFWLLTVWPLHDILLYLKTFMQLYMVPCLDMVVAFWMWCPWASAQLSIWFIRPCHLDNAFAICWPSNRILIFLSMFLVISLEHYRKQALFTELLVSFLAHHCWPLRRLSIIPATWSALAETHLHTYQRHSGLGSSSHWLLATSEPEREAAGKLAFHFKSDACFFCPLKVWMKSGAVHSSAVHQAFTENSHSPVTMFSQWTHNQSPLAPVLISLLLLSGTMDR